MKINNFILNTDYATLKNDTQSNAISLTIPSGTTFNPGTPDVEIASTTKTIGTINAGLRSRGKSSKYAYWTIGSLLITDVICSIPSLSLTGVQVWWWCYLKRINVSTVKLFITTEFSGGAPNFVTSEDITISFVFSTFLSPFD